MVPKVVESIVFLLCLEDIAIILAIITSNKYPSTNLPSYSSNFNENTSVCWTDNIVYNDQDVVPAATPCEHCICNPPNIVCSVIECEVKSDCNIIRKSNHCCPDYKCDCEYNGRSFNNGQKIDTSDIPCRVCYCRGGEIICTTIECYLRNDCEGKIVPGICCPKYDHCPPSASNTSTIFVTSDVTSKTSKLRSQPRTIITDSVRTSDSGEFTTSSDEVLDVITEITWQQPAANIITVPQEQISSKDDVKLYSSSDIPGGSLSDSKNLTEISSKSEMARGVHNSTEGVTKNFNDETRIPDVVIVMRTTTTFSSNNKKIPSDTKLAERNEYRARVNVTNSASENQETLVKVDENGSNLNALFAHNVSRTSATENQETLVKVDEKGSNLNALFAHNVSRTRISSLINSADKTASYIESIQSTESATLVPVQNISSIEATEISNLDDSRTVEEIIRTFGENSITTEVLDVNELFNDEGVIANSSSIVEAELNSTKDHSFSTIELVSSTQGGYYDTTEYHELLNTTTIINGHEIHGTQIVVNSSTLYRDVNTVDKFGTASLHSNIDFASTTTSATTNHNTGILSETNNASLDSTIGPSTPTRLDYIASGTYIDTTSSRSNTSSINGGAGNDTNGRSSTISHFYLFENGSADPFNLTATFGNDRILFNYTDSFTQKYLAHPMKLISSVNSVYSSPESGSRESSVNKSISNECIKVVATPEIPHTNSPAFKIWSAGLKPVTRSPNSTTGPLSWLKGSIPLNVTATPHVTTNNESLKNESRQESGPKGKVYNPLMPYPDEYPEEYQTIQNGPAIIITRTTYTRIPDVTWTTVTMAALPTYERLQKAEHAFAATLFEDRQFGGKRFHAGEKKSSDDVVASGHYFDIDVKTKKANVVKVESLDDGTFVDEEGQFKVHS